MASDSVCVPSEELQSRLAKLQKSLAEKGIDGALIVQKTDLFYFAATSQQGWLYVPVAGKPMLMVFKEYERACRESPLENIVSLVSLKEIPAILARYGYQPPAVLGLELDVLPTNLYFQYRANFKDARIEDISLEIRLIRAVKSEFELEKIRAAIKLSDTVAAHVPELLVVGKTEVALAGELEAYARSLGHQGIVRMRMWGSELFYGHLMAGDDAAVGSYLASPTGGTGVSSVIGQGAGFRKIGANEPVLVDYVFALDGYISDHTRIFSIGRLSAELEAAHEAMLEIQNEMKAQARPGAVTGELYELMVSLAQKKGYAENFMGVGEKRIRFTGHGVGLELDEFPFIAKGQQLELQKGMVIAFEPKTIFPGRGVVGIENTHLVTEDGLESPSRFPDEITVLP
ncbi:aminopeptidase P family protein [Desulfopila sp. IMCC35006]|uniref:M24 family metallopeptidase n=1 Tax=Desulfopila sp. IMCC35006 TaxID=2569542 RepID=UPI0010ACD168|nr:Xaa-Pro peptidase family protein [Desulfopila sp. IMCC35006]TKB26539.1 aminopeptidase P family protein [Desulfopila sp. IMCC35006]